MLLVLGPGVPLMSSFEDGLLTVYKSLRTDKKPLMSHVMRPKFQKICSRVLKSNSIFYDEVGPSFPRGGPGKEIPLMLLKEYLR